MVRLHWIALAALLIVPGPAQPQDSELPSWVLDLSRLKRHLRPLFERMPNYVCIETVDRFHASGRNPELKHLDTLRLEVAIVGGKELYSLAGEGHFTESNPGAFITEGTLGSGAFGTTACNLFVNDAGRTTGFQKETDGGRAVLRYDYEIPQMLHPLRVSSQGRTASVGERGFFVVDAGTLDLLEIQDEAVDIPPLLGIQDAKFIVHYERVRIGSSDMLLPKTAETLMTNFDGSRSRNLIGFSACRQYSSDSKITFGDPPQN